MTIIILSATGCGKKENTPVNSSAGKKRGRTMIIYMVSNNNLHESLWDNIEEIAEAVGYNNDCHVIAFVDTKKDNEGISQRISELISYC